MKERVRRSLESVYATEIFLNINPHRVPTELSPLIKRLKSHIAGLRKLEMAEHRHKPRREGSTSQGEAGRGIRRKQDLLRQDFLIPIGRAGRKVMKFAPGSADAFVVPPKRSTAQEIVASARRMAKAARPQWKLFVEIGFSSKMAAQMIAAASELERMAADGTWARRERTDTLRQLDKEIRATRAVIDVIDARLVSLGRDDKALLDHWRRSKRIPKKLGRPRKGRGQTGTQTGAASSASE